LLRASNAKAQKGRSEGRPAAYIQVETGTSILVVTLVPGQQVVFRMDSLLGFSSGVTLKTAYSTHAGLFFLGLGSFYHYAEGDGHIALLANGGWSRPAKKDEEAFASNLLAWDRRAKFGLAHLKETTDDDKDHEIEAKAAGLASRSVGHWFSQSQLILSSKDGAIMLDNSKTVIDGYGRHALRLFRYLVLPF
jgi:hypothetical protein